MLLYRNHSLTPHPNVVKIIELKNSKGARDMKEKILRGTCAGLLFISFLGVPGSLLAQQSNTQEVNGWSVLGSVLFSVLHVPFKLATCVGAQTGAAVAYTTTFGVAGNYDGGTNGKEIGEVARRSCTGDWIITPEQVSNDYQ
jgi:hypothetical protein